MLKRYLLMSSACCSLLVALLHVYVIINGAPAYRFFGAGETLASMAGWRVWPLPKLRLGLIVIAAIYTLRGAAVLPALLFRMHMSAFDLWSSWISLAIGVLHCLAAWLYIRDDMSSS